MIDIPKVCSQLGIELIDVVAQRRGSVLLKALREGSLVAIKGYDLDETDVYDRKELLGREARVLEEVNPFLDVSLFAAYVSLEESGDWLITNWIEGVTASEFSRNLPGDNEASRLVGMFRSVAHTLIKVHAAGFLHGDIQPAHVIIPSDQSPVLIDWGLARRIHDTVPYSGGFVHFAAPEIAQGMIEQRSDIAYKTSAEIYSFGALMAFCYSGNTAVAYNASEPLLEKLAKVADGNLREFSNPESVEDQALLSIIKQCLSFSPEDRPASFREVEKLLSSIR